MGNSSSSLAELVHDGDIQGLKAQLAQLCTAQRERHPPPLHEEDSREEDHAHRQDHEDAFALELEEAVHAALDMPIDSPHQPQQRQIALEMLLQVHPRALRSSLSNSCRWTALHTACARGNLGFVPFLHWRFAAHTRSTRDAFGFLPFDLVPPELLTDGGREAGRENSCCHSQSTQGRRLVAVELLRAEKEQWERDALRAYMEGDGGACAEDMAHGMLKKPQHASGQTDKYEDGARLDRYNEEEAEGDGGEKHSDDPDFYVHLECTRDHLPPQLTGCVHELDAPLRVRYRLPRVDAVLHGYFQLVWRGEDDPRNEAPQYDQYLFMQDEMIGQEQEQDPIPTAEDMESSQQGGTRQLDHQDQHDTHHQHVELSGGFPINVSHLPALAVCHVLFIASDKHMMRRQVVMRSGPVRLHSTSQYSDGTRPWVGEAHELEGGFEFYVAGETFVHPSEHLAGKEFVSVEEFQAFVQALREKQARPRNIITGGNESDATIKESKDEGEVRSAAPSCSHQPTSEGDPAKPIDATLHALGG